jgi:hypothetical protein
VFVVVKIGSQGKKKKVFSKVSNRLNNFKQMNEAKTTFFFFILPAHAKNRKKKLNYNNNKKALPISTFSSLCTKKKKLNLN